MNYLKAILVFIFSALCVVVFIGYIDEGNAKNYSSFCNYLLTDAIKDNFYKDTGRHIWTIILSMLWFLTYVILHKLRIMKNYPFIQIIYALLLFPLAIFIIVILTKVIINLF